MKCIKCNREENETAALISCDGCSRSVHKTGCSDLTASEIKVMDLKGKRSLRFFCEDCSKGLLQVPKLIKAVEEIRAELASLKLSKDTQSTHTLPSNETVFDEIHERQIRSNNLMIYNLQEDADDLPEVQQLLHTILPSELVSVVRITRIGKPNVNNRRPVKVSLSSATQVVNLLKNSSKLKGKRIYIGADLTPKQREIEKSVKQAIRERRSQGEANIYLKYSNGIPKIVSKN